MLGIGAAMHPQSAEDPRDVYKLRQTEFLANMSPNNFIRNFHKVKGMSPMAYVSQLRMDMAGSMLLSPERPSISRIAQACGFPDSNYFARRFKHFHGVSPSHYRHARG